MELIFRDCENKILCLINNSPWKRVPKLGMGWQWISLNLIWLWDGDSFLTRYWDYWRW